MIWVWIAVIGIAIIVEVISAQLLSIWFAVGGAAALAASFFTDNIAIQVFLFFAVSIAALAIIYPLAKKSLKTDYVKTNADRYVGKLAVVTEEISNIDARGQVKVDNQIWSARSKNGDTISEGTLVHVLKIEGVKLIVSVNENN